MLANDPLSIWLRCGWLEAVGKWQFKCDAMTCWTFCEPNSVMGSAIPLFCYALPTDSCLWILLHLFAADLLYSPCAWFKLYLKFRRVLVPRPVVTWMRFCRMLHLTRGFSGVYADVHLFWLASLNDPRWQGFMSESHSSAKIPVKQAMSRLK